MKATFLDRGSFPNRVHISPPSVVSQWQEYDQTRHDQIISRCQNAQVVLVNKVNLTRDIITQLKQTKLICVTATGVNNVDLNAAREHNITVVNATNYGTESVSEHVLMLMLSLARNLPIYLQRNNEKHWAQSAHFCDIAAPMRTLHGKTLAILGMGVLGSAVANLAKNFGMQLIKMERPNSQTIRSGYCEFNQALAQADFVSLHCPLTEHTEQLVNDKMLKQMKPSALLINSGRGGLVNEIELLNALKAGTIAGAALDVATHEPPKKDDTIWQLSQLENVIVTPHIAWAADEAMATLMTQIFEKIAAFAEGKPVTNLASDAE